jgi:hypothetical protein
MLLAKDLRGEKPTHFAAEEGMINESNMLTQFRDIGSARAFYECHISSGSYCRPAIRVG